MQMHWKSLSRRLLVTCAALLLSLGGALAFAQHPTSSGNLTVTATVNSSIQLTFSTASNGVGLTGAGSSAATLAFGSISLYGQAPTNVTINASPSFCSSCFSASTPVSIVVSQADGTSVNYTLAAYLNAAPAHGETLAVDGVAIASTTEATPTQINATASYGTGYSPLVSIGVPLSTSNGQGFSDQIDFVATAN